MLVYRSILDLPTGDPATMAAELFREWLGEHAPGLEIPDSGSASLGDVSVTTASAPDRPAYYGRMARESEDGDVWTTTVTADAGASRWFWLDLERVSNHPDREGPVPRPPRIVSRLLGIQECFCGEIQVGSGPATADSDVERLLDELFHESRILPTVVVSNRWGEGRQQLDRVALALASGLAGIAHVWRLGDTATTKLKDEVGELAVWGGALRIYRPGMAVGTAESFRHPVIPFARLRDPDTALRAVHRVVLPLTGSRKPPASYGEVRLLPGFPGARQLAPGQDFEVLFEEVDKEKTLLESQLGEARRQLDDLGVDLLEEREEVTESQRELQSAAARIAYLEGKLGSMGESAFDDLPDEQIEIVGCANAVELAESSLSHVAFCDGIVATAEQLDSHGKAEIWGNRAYRAFAALDRYAQVKKADSGSCAGFDDFSARADSSPERLPENWIAMRESETVDNDRRFKAARTFTLSLGDGTQEAMYMPAHIKVQRGKPPAPRIHFHDDTQGQSGKVWIGYFGQHLPSPSTN